MAIKKKEEEQTGYQSKWQSQLDDVTDQILNRKPFEYDLNGDAFYNQYKDKFVQQGKMAMMDTMGQAAGLTGGYGSSYAQQVGQQTYQGHLQGLNDVIPELYQLAMDSYDRQGAALADKYNLLADREARDYSRYTAQQKAVQSVGSPDEVTDEADTDKTGGVTDITPKETESTKRFISSHMTLEQALSRGITRKEWTAMMNNWLGGLDLSDAEYEYLEQYYGIT